MANTGEDTGPMLYLAQFDAESAQFHLCIDTAQILQFALLVIACKVTGFVHLGILSERALYKLLMCQFLTRPVALGNLNATETQFSCNTL